MKKTSLFNPSRTLLLLLCLGSFQFLVTGCGGNKAEEERIIKLRNIMAKYKEPWKAYSDAMDKVRLKIEEFDADSLGESPDFERATADNVWETVRALQPAISVDQPYGNSNYVVLSLRDIGGKMDEEFSLYETNTYYAAAEEFMKMDTSSGNWGYEEPLTVEANMSQVSVDKIPYLFVYDVFARMDPEVEDLKGFDGGMIIAQIFLFDLRTSQLVRRGAVIGENSDNVNYTHTEGSNEEIEFRIAAKSDLDRNMRREIMDWVKKVRDPEPVEEEEDEAEDEGE